MRIGLVLGVAVWAACGSRTSAPAGAPVHESDAPPAVLPAMLRPPAAFELIADRGDRSRALFTELSRVLLHPRCVNCHPADETPRQGDLHDIHDPPVTRGAADRGVPAMQCPTCHQDKNAELARIPGAPGWHLAPTAMAWLGKSPHDICQQLKDRKRNGDRSLADIHDHIANDRLVGWGWAPGADRVPAPGTQAEAGALVQAWIDSGAECP